MNSTTLTTINELIKICKDSQTGFRDASENIQNSELQTLFEGYSLQRSKFVGELHEILLDLGTEPETTSSFASALHRGWIDLKAAFTKESDHAILVECERGEDHAVSAYRMALTEELPANIRKILTRQCTAVQVSHHDIRDRRDAQSE